jgi:phosphatidylglycerol lysyltransferase
MTDPYLLPRMAGRRLFVAQQAGHPVGFAVLSPVPARRGWLVEQIVRGGLAPNGTAESLVAAAAEAVAAGGSRFFTLGAAPLARRGPQRSDRHPLWLRAVTAWMRAHGTRFYNFRGLEHFKAKLAPRRWEPVFAVANESRIRPATLYAVLGAFAGRSPAWGLIQAVGRGLATEIKNLNGSLLTTGSK